MNDYPDHNVIDILRNIVQICENHKISRIQVGSIKLEFAFQAPKAELGPRETSEEISQRKFQEDMAIKYAHTGVVPAFLWEKK